MALNVKFSCLVLFYQVNPWMKAETFNLKDRSIAYYIIMLHRFTLYSSVHSRYSTIIYYCF